LKANGTVFAASVSLARKGCPGARNCEPDELPPQRRNVLLSRSEDLRRAAPTRRSRAPISARWRNGRRFFRSLVIITSVGLYCLGIKGAEQESREKYEAQFQIERDPVVKAKILAKLGRFEIDQARADLKADKEEQSLADLEHYRDQVESTVAALSATGVNAEQHPSGFKELQISLRETLRHIDELIIQLPLDKRPWFQAVRSDLARSQNSLIEALFPSLGEKRSKRGDP
jgi:hypothetical protein